MEYPCNICTKPFKTERGMKLHRTKMHKHNNTVVASVVATPAEPVVASHLVETSTDSMIKNLLLFMTQDRERDEKRRQEERERERLREERDEKRRQEERERERLREEQEEKRRQEERERERLREEQEEKRRQERQVQYELEEKRRQEDDKKRREEHENRMHAIRENGRLNLETEKEKTRRMIEYCRAQEKAIDEWKEARMKELEQRDRYLDEVEANRRRYDQYNRRVSTCDKSLHGRDELVIYGTSGRPLFKKTELVAYCNGYIWEDPPVGFEPVREAMETVIDSMSFQDTFMEPLSDYRGTIPAMSKDNFVEVAAWEMVAEDIGEMLGLSNKEVEFKVFDMYSTLPYSSVASDWKDHRETMMSVYRQPVTTEAHEMAFEKKVSQIPVAGVASSTIFVEQDCRALVTAPTMVITSDTILENTDDYSFKPSYSLKKEDVVGGADETVSSTKYRLQRQRHLLDVLTDFVQKNPTHKRWVVRGWIIMVARLYVILDRLHKTGYYAPDAMERYQQDTLFKVRNQNIVPESRRVFQRRHFYGQDTRKCQMCNKELHRDGPEWERAHIVPSRKRKLGSDGPHNFLVCCRACNYHTGDVDPHLLDGFDYKQNRDKSVQSFSHIAKNTR